MRLPTLRGTIERRILVNYRVDPEVLANILPAPFRPKLVQGHAMAGICLIRLRHVRPAFIPFPIGLGSENGAHRFAVEWEHNGQTRGGVYIPRRDTSSRLNAWVGGTLFPGEHHHATFDIDESEASLHVAYESDDASTRVCVDAEATDTLPADSIFNSLQDASDFFKEGDLGYSDTRGGDRYDGMELSCDHWAVQPLHVRGVVSNYFEDTHRFPPGSVTLDHALLMRGIEHEWHTRESLPCGGAAAGG